ncbi:MAG: hypothetical protein HY790_01085 [Deltaproteobacteria bacterium]|nr:hypothetical protein [Deltaproteobacteria bacterium]MBI4794434.1 hypothetical protein [Deltaproteobacteria bacterium]
MARTICMLLVATLLFSFSSPFSLPSSGAKLAYAQATAPAPEKPAKPKIVFKGGPGDTPETAVVISGAPNSRVGINAEYYYLMKKFGQPNADWKLKRQSVLHVKGKDYDRMEIELKDGSKKDVFFDITEFFGKL